MERYRWGGRGLSGRGGRSPQLGGHPSAKAVAAVAAIRRAATTADLNTNTNLRISLTSRAAQSAQRA